MIKRILSFSNPAYLSLKLGQIVYEAKDDPEKNTTIPIEDVGVVILDGKQLTITSALMSKSGPEANRPCCAQTAA